MDIAQAGHSLLALALGTDMKTLLLALLLLCSPAYAITYSGVCIENCGDKTTLTGNTLTDLFNNGGLLYYKSFPSATDMNANGANGSLTGTFIRSSATTMPATYVNASGDIISNTTTNSPRIVDYYYGEEGHTASSGWLVEPTSTNYAYNSFFSQGSTNWANTAGTALTFVNDYANPYLGGQVAKFTGAVTSDRFYVGTRFTSVATTYTVSALVRGSGTVAIRWIDGSGAGSFGSKRFTLSDKWVLIHETFVEASGGAQTGCGIGLATDNAVTAYVSYIQCEPTTAPTSFIPSVSSYLSRGAEYLYYAITQNRKADTEAVFISFDPKTTVSSTTGIRSFGGTQTKNRNMYFSGASFGFWGNIDDSASSTASSTVVPVGGLTYNWAMISNNISAPYVSVWSNGRLVGSNSATNFITPAWSGNFFVGSNVFGGSQLNGIVKSVAVYQTPKTEPDIRKIQSIMTPNKQLMTFGASMAYAVGGGYFPSTLKTSFVFSGQYKNGNIPVSAIAGETSAQLLARLDSNISYYAPNGERFAYLLVGSNDVAYSVGVPTYTQNITDIINRVLSAGATRVYVSNMPPRNDGLETASLPYNAIYPSVLTQFGDRVSFMDIHATFLLNANWTTELISADNLHPTAAGYQLMADTLKNSMIANGDY